MSHDDTVVDEPFDHSPAGHTRLGTPRLIALDVTRALALLGVIVMNYHGYLNDHSSVDNAGRIIERSLAERIFHPFDGIVATRFAATFVLVAGMGVTLLTARSRRAATDTTLAGDRALLTDDRWRLVRRGLLLYVTGYVLDWVWPGTILFFYGAYFMIAALMVTLRSRTLLGIGAACALVAAAVSQWRFVEALDGHDTRWLVPDPDSPRNLLFATLFGGTHPVFPWLAFLCVGMVIGRSLPRLEVIRSRLVGLGVGIVVVTAVIHTAGPPTPDRLGTIPPGSTRTDAVIGHLLSMRPTDHGLLYTLSALGSAIAAFAIISWIAERFATTSAIVMLRRAGQLTLTLYLVHVFAYLLIVDVFHAVRPTGLDTAILFALAVWLIAVAAGAWYQRRFGRGPFERVYRAFGG